MFRIMLLVFSLLMVSANIYAMLVTEERKTSLACFIQTVIFLIYFCYIWFH